MWCSTSDPPPLVVVEPADPVRLHEVRAVARQWLAQSARLPQDLTEDVVLMVSELWTNAVQASPPRGSIELSLSLHDDAVVVDTVDAGAGFIRPIPHELPAAESVTGRGLALVNLLGADLSWERCEGRTLVRAAVPLPD